MNDKKAFYADEEDQSDIDIDITPVNSKAFFAPMHEFLNSIEEEQKHDNSFSINNQQQEEKQDDARDKQLSISSCSEYYDEEENKS